MDDKLTIQELEVRIKDLIHKHLNDTWVFKWDNCVKRYGSCYSAGRLITISKKLALLNTWEETRNTVLHEIAHGIVGNIHGHDQVWQNACRMIGGDGQRCYNMAKVNMPEQRYMAICPECGHPHYKSRIPKRRTSCGVCHPEAFTPSVELVYNLNPNYH